ncbi:hypothetical protein [Staphylococcus capitis]|uniref:hypothetical protein n=1 Tax=Staphylococcus capitis TaxID=29388 RepID=UPI0016433FCD|nr:hypothetical protein [Staphylococcus capitis]
MIERGIVVGIKGMGISVVMVMKRFIMMRKNIQVVMVRVMIKVMEMMREIEVMMSGRGI